jgi:Zn-dependent metalloprotease
MKKYFMAIATALSLLSLKGQKVFNLAQKENDEYGNIRFIKPSSPVEFSKENEIYLLNSLLSAGTRKELSFKLNKTLTEDGYTHNNYKFAYNGIPVSGAGFSFHIKNNQILFANGLIPVFEKWLSIKPILSEKDAIEKAGSYFIMSNQLDKLTKPLHAANKGLEFVYKNNTATLCYKIEAGRSNAWIEEYIYASTINGDIVKSLPTVCRSHEPANTNKSTEVF